MNVQEKTAAVKKQLAGIAVDMAAYLADRPGWDGPERVEFERVKKVVEGLGK